MIPANEAQAREQGWKRCFSAEEPRLSEMVEAYRELGLEVITVPVDLDAAACSECLRFAPGRCRVIYTRVTRPDDL